MKRDIANIQRDLENRKNNDIILKKYKIEKMFNEDPDLKELLGVKPKKPKNKFADPENPTEEELKLRQEIEDYNEKVSKSQIVPWLKINDMQKEVLNYIMFDIRDYDVHRYNKVIKNQEVTVMCVVLEQEMETEYGVPRVDLLSYIVKDLLCWTNSLGITLKCISDKPTIIDSRYYAREITFNTEAPNTTPYGVNNPYDVFP